MHVATSAAFKENAHSALADAGLQKALARSGPSFIARRTAAVAALPEFEQLRDIARDIKNHTLANLDFYLETWANNVEQAGGQVHWCATADEARAAVLNICRAANARTVTKGKSMISEELGINDHLERHGITPVETDLGEYIIQLRHELPSHIIAPAFHLNKEDWEDSFRKSHTDLPPDRVFRERRDILTEARTKLREKFLAADVGITGANFAIWSAKAGEIASKHTATTRNNDFFDILHPPLWCAFTTVLAFFIQSHLGRDFPKLNRLI